MVKMATERFWAEKKAWWLTQTLTVQGYCSGAIFMLMSLGFFLHDAKSTAAEVSMYVSCMFFSAAFLIESYLWVVPKLNLPLIKFAVTAFSVMALGAATGISRLTVNGATSQEATNFPSTVAILIPISFIPVLATLITVLSLGFALSVTFWAVVAMALRRGKIGDLELLVLFSRLFASMALGIFSAALINGSSPASSWMRWIASYSAYGLDLHTDQSCIEDSRDKVLRINDELIILGRMTDIGPQFVRRTCPLDAEPTELRLPQSSSKHRSDGGGAPPFDYGVIEVRPFDSA